MERYPQSQVMVLNAYTAVATAVFTVMFVLALFADILLLEIFDRSLSFAPKAPLPLVLLGLSALSLLAHVGLALAHKCPRCNKHPTIQGFASPHPSVAAGGDDAWAAVIREVLKKRTFTCIHCGSTYRVSEDA
ncbi:hypothetical protein QFW77_02745 [Luteimonas sp. RD2P54]|uniref:Uncharacterized protein n=1 Tax=Luteimonas endophytica TaxID=3042023 RepID=A0ABT6J518_9GAMM|nr:hypothetical protein [Luteimonas endophytica]MDH5821913.1 hypothetical protein [Luteimonas endophytica]